MARYRPTFKVSPLKRPWYRRLTPLAWFTVGVGLVVVVLVVLAFCMACGSQPTTEPWSPTLNPTSAPTPTAEPSVPPTETAVLTSAPTHAPSVWWADQMIEDEQGHLQPPPEVQDQVWEAFITGLGCSLIADGEMPPDNVAVFREAMRHLADDPQVRWMACNTAQTDEEILNERRVLISVAFGPRNAVICDESPTRCKTAVAAEIKGFVVYQEDSCSQLGMDETPCLATGVMHPWMRALFVGTLGYDNMEGIWRVVELERKDL